MTSKDNIMKVWEKYHISPTICYVFQEMYQKDKKSATTYIFLAVKNNHFMDYKNNQKTTQEIISILGGKTTWQNKQKNNTYNKSTKKD